MLLDKGRAPMNSRLVAIHLALSCLVMIDPATATTKETDDIRDAPAQLASSSRIAPVGEPGTPLVISGTVVGADGKTALAGAIVYAYHTDRTGHYGSGAGGSEDSPRLKAWVKTDSNGRFEFTTIKPAPCPNRDVPAHIHVHVWGAGYPRQWFEIEFAGDPLLSKQHFTDNSADFLYIVPLAEHSGDLQGTVIIRMRRISNFSLLER
jgi:protocatechuate 3,4-dioxygenase beta subunit